MTPDASEPGGSEPDVPGPGGRGLDGRRPGRPGLGGRRPWIWPHSDPVSLIGPGSGWRFRLRAATRTLFPAVFLVYSLHVIDGLAAYSGPVATAAGLVALGAFWVAYLVALWSVRGASGRFWTAFAVMAVACGYDLLAARQYALTMFVFIGVLLIAQEWRRSVPINIALVVAAAVLPGVVPGWEASNDPAGAASIAIILLANYAFIGTIRANHQLEEARVEIGRLATENERNRIARDLHDLLGHSLTVITLKATLARRMVAAGKVEAAAGEMAAVEDLSRQALVDVRAAVSGYREVSLAGELATGAEILRAAGIDSDLPDDVTMVADRHRPLFAWVVREGLTNVVRHARARSCRVELGPDWVEVVDDGTSGGDRGAGAGSGPGAGSGLAGLAERVAEAAGTLTVGRSREGGWKLRVEMAGGQDVG